MPTLGLDRNSHSIPATAGGDRIGQQEHRLIDGGAAHDFVGHHRKEQPRGQRQHGDRETEHCGDLDRGEVERIGKDGGEILEPDKTGRQTKGIAALHRLQDRLPGWPEEEDKGHRKLRR